MSDRHRLTDPERLAAFGDRFLQAVADALRTDDPDITDEEVAAVMSRAEPPMVAWATLRERHKVSDITETDIKIKRGVAWDADELASLRRRLPGGANRGGRGDESESRLADYRTAIVELAKRYPENKITAELVLNRLHRTGSVSQLREDVSRPDIGGWRRFRAEVLRGRLSGR